MQHIASRRLLHTTYVRRAVTNFSMPAMSPTMTEGSIAQWKKKEGESFTVGDILLEIETDKATIDVEAQEDGIMGRILAQDGAKNIPVGKVIALLAEEGDDISNLEAPKEESVSQKAESSTSKEIHEDSASSPPAQLESASQSQSQLSARPSPRSTNHIGHSRPLFPSVLRLLQENDVGNPEDIKGTGVRGMLTKGDVLAYLSKASSPSGTYKEKKEITDVTPKKEEQKPLDGPAIRKLIVSSLLESSVRARTPPPPAIAYDFNSIISDYFEPPTSTLHPVPPLPSTLSTPTEDYFNGIL